MVHQRHPVGEPEASSTATVLTAVDSTPIIEIRMDRVDGGVDDASAVQPPPQHLSDQDGDALRQPDRVADAEAQERVVDALAVDLNDNVRVLVRPQRKVQVVIADVCFPDEVPTMHCRRRLEQPRKRDTGDVNVVVDAATDRCTGVHDTPDLVGLDDAAHRQDVDSLDVISWSSEAPPIESFELRINHGPVALVEVVGRPGRTAPMSAR